MTLVVHIHSTPQHHELDFSGHAGHYRDHIYREVSQYMVYFDGLTGIVAETMSYGSVNIKESLTNVFTARS